MLQPHCCLLIVTHTQCCSHIWFLFRYYQLADELLKTVRKTEESLKRLKKATTDPAGVNRHTPTTSLGMRWMWHSLSAVCGTLKSGYLSQDTPHICSHPPLIISSSIIIWWSLRFFILLMIRRGYVRLGQDRTAAPPGCTRVRQSTEPAVWIVSVRDGVVSKACWGGKSTEREAMRSPWLQLVFFFGPLTFGLIIISLSRLIESCTGGSPAHTVHQHFQVPHLWLHFNSAAYLMSFVILATAISVI